MPGRDPEQRYPEPGSRVSLRRVLASGGEGDLVGFVVSADAGALILRDRRGHDHSVAWSDLRALRRVGVARGRDPLRTPVAELDLLAANAGVVGRAFVIRLSDLLESAPVVPLGRWSDPPPVPASLAGEWVTAGAGADVLALARWAAHHDARSLQLRVTDPATAASLEALGFTGVAT